MAAQTHRRLQIWTTLGCFVVCCLVAAPTFAQTRLASLQGTVTDETGGALPGVTVTATSPALQLPQLTQVSGPDGAYRFTDLPLGEYRLAFELPGFKSFVREGVVLTAGFVARIDALMNVGTLEETVTVSGQTPVVDVVSTRGGTTISSDVITTTPNSRNYQDLLNMTPGVTVAAPPQMGEVGFRALTGGIRTYGLLGQTQTQIEGLQMSESAFPDFSTADQVDIKTFGNSADVAQPGAVTDLIVKSGSNAFHGRFLEQFMNSSMQATNLDDRLRAQGLRTGDGIRFYQDFAGDLGGRIVRDRLWFYGAYRDIRNERTLTGYSRAPGPDNVYGTGDDVPGYPPALQTNQTVKVSSQLTRANRLIGFFQRNWVVENQAQASRFIPFEATREVQWEPLQYKVEWQATPSNRFFYNLAYGRTSEEIFYVATTTNAPARFDRRTNIQTGAYSSVTAGGRDDIFASQSKRHTITGSVNIYPAEFLGGAHEFKVGGRAWLENRWSQFDDRVTGNYRLTYDLGVPAQIQTFDFPMRARDFLNEYSAYAMDQWRIGAGVTLNLGLRWEKMHGFQPEQTKPQGQFGGVGTFPRTDVVRWNAVAPRVAAAWDIVGNGKTVVKTSYGWYNYRVSAVSFVSVFNQIRPQATTYIWRDLDGNNDYTPGIGEVNLSLNGPDFIATTGGNSNRINLALEQPHTHEITGSFEREIARETSLRLLYVYKQTRDDWEAVNVLRPPSAYNIQLTRQDPGPDGRLNTADDGGPVTIFDFDPAFRGAAFVGNQFVTRANSDHFHTFEATVTKRRSDRWSLIASFATTKNHRFIDAILESPNDKFPLDETRDWTIKMAGSYRLPWALEASALYDVFNGDYGQRTYLFGAVDPDGGPPLRQLSGGVTVRLEPYGSRQTPVRHNLNLRLGRVIRLPRSQRVRLELDALNALNTNVAWGRGVPGIDYRSGPTFGYVTQLVAPRIFRVGVTYEF